MLVRQFILKVYILFVNILRKFQIWTFGFKTFWFYTLLNIIDSQISLLKINVQKSVKLSKIISMNDNNVAVKEEKKEAEKENH